MRFSMDKIHVPRPITPNYDQPYLPLSSSQLTLNGPRIPVISHRSAAGWAQITYKTVQEFREFWQTSRRAAEFGLGRGVK